MTDPNSLTEDKYYAKIYTLIREHMRWNDFRASQWMTTPNPMFGGTSPEILIRNGRGRKVLQFVESVIEEDGL